MKSGICLRCSTDKSRHLGVIKLFDFFKAKKKSAEVSDKRKLISRIIIAIVLAGGVVLGFITSGNTTTSIDVSEVFSFRFSIVDVVIIIGMVIAYIIIRISRRRNGGK